MQGFLNIRNMGLTILAWSGLTTPILTYAEEPITTSSRTTITSTQSQAVTSSLDAELIKLIQSGTIPQLHKAMASNKLSAELLTTYFLQQIERHEKVINAIITLNPNAISIAKRLDQERAKVHTTGLLHGIPILIKDNIETKEMATTAGSLALKDNHTHRDAPIIDRLRKAGAIILGKTNLSEWANFRSERSSSGWSAVGGQTNNPHDITRNPCGSSAGSGAAVAAYFAVAALGTETNGSIVCPSSANGVVGIKPSTGLVSRTGIVPISHSQDTAGPMARNVTDAAIILSVIQGYDDKDDITQAAQIYQQRNYFDALQADSLAGKRIGVLRSNMSKRQDVTNLTEKAINHLRKAGAEIVEDLHFKPYDDFWDDTYNILLFEFKHDLNVYLKGLPTNSNQLSLKKLIQFNRDHQQQEMPYFGQEIFLKAEETAGLTDKTYIQALSKAQQATRQDGIDFLLKKYKLDALIAPTLGPAWKTDLIMGDNYGDGFSSFPAISGYPHITVPMGKIHNLPIGLSFTAGAFSEDKLIAMAYAFEQMMVLKIAN